MIDSMESVLLLMAEILHQLRLVVSPIICNALYIPGGAGFLPATVVHSNYCFFNSTCVLIGGLVLGKNKKYIYVSPMIYLPCFLHYLLPVVGNPKPKCNEVV